MVGRATKSDAPRPARDTLELPSPRLNIMESPQAGRNDDASFVPCDAICRAREDDMRRDVGFSHFARRRAVLVARHGGRARPSTRAAAAFQLFQCVIQH